MSNFKRSEQKFAWALFGKEGDLLFDDADRAHVYWSRRTAQAALRKRTWDWVGEQVVLRKISNSIEGEK